MLVLAAPAMGGEFSLRDAAFAVSLEPMAAGRTAVTAPAFLQDTGVDVPPHKSPAKAVLLSLLVPGLGHHYVGQTQRAHAFLLAEGVIWTTFTVFQVQGFLRERGYEDFAVTFGNVSSTDHSEDFYFLLTLYNSSEEYEEFIKSEGRAFLYPQADHAALEQYFVDNRVADYEPWTWSSNELRRDFRSRRSASETAYRRALYAAATALANRAASAFFAIKAARDYNKRSSAEQSSTFIEFGPHRPGYNVLGEFETGVSIVRTF